MAESVVLEEQNKFTFFIASAFTLNYIVGTGFLTLPWAFQMSGAVLSIFCLFVMTLLSIVTSFFLLETMARATELDRRIADKVLFDEIGMASPASSSASSSLPVALAATSVGTKVDGNSIYNTVSAANPNSHNTSVGYQLIANSLHNDDNLSRYDDESMSLMIVGNRKMEIPELCELFLGVIGKRVYTASIAIYLFGTLWAYSTVFSNALTSHFNLGDNSYGIYLLIYSVIVIPPSLMELSEQIILQVALSLCRVLMLLMMIYTILDSEYFHTNTFNDFQFTAASSGGFHLNKLYILLPIAAFANIFHHSIPGLSSPVIDKTQLGAIYSCTLLFCFVGYALIGLIISSYFGKDTLSACNLNWEHYTGTGKMSTITRFISFYVVLFPAFDVSSTFPLCAITLGNSLMSSYFGNEMHKHENSRCTRIIFRLLASIPPIIGAVFISDLGQVTHFTGVTGFFIAFIFPALLSRQSEKKLQAHGMPTRTHYSSWLTSRWMQYIVLGLGSSLFVFVCFSLLFLGEVSE